MQTANPKNTTLNKKSGLGRGFDSLIPQNFDRSILVDDSERIQKISVKQIVANPNQPRTMFDVEALEQLAASIKNHGILQPLVVTPAADGYEIIAGERRWRASQIAGLKKVPVIVRTTKELESLEIALVENVQRVDLSPLDQAVSIEKLNQQFNIPYDDIAKRLGKASSTVYNIVRLLQLPEAAHKSLHEKKISEGHARAILALKGMPEKQDDLLRHIIQDGWSVRQAERYVVSVKEGYKDKKATEQRMSTETPATKQLSSRIGVPVHIRRMAKGGKLEIVFKTDEELQKILDDLS